MDGDDAPLPLSKSKRKRNRIGMVLAPIERQRYLAGSQIHDLTIATIIIDNGDEVPIAGGMQSPPQDMARPGFVIRRRRDINGSKMNPITSVGIPSNDGSALCEHQPDRPLFLIYGNDIDDGSNLLLIGLRPCAVQPLDRFLSLQRRVDADGVEVVDGALHRHLGAKISS